MQGGGRVSGFIFGCFVLNPETNVQETFFFPNPGPILHLCSSKYSLQVDVTRGHQPRNVLHHV